MLFSPLKHYLDLYITDTALKVSRTLYCVTTSLSHGVDFPRLWGTGISDAIFPLTDLLNAGFVRQIALRIDYVLMRNGILACLIVRSI